MVVNAGAGQTSACLSRVFFFGTFYCAHSDVSLAQVTASLQLPPEQLILSSPSSPRRHQLSLKQQNKHKRSRAAARAHELV